MPWSNQSVTALKAKFEVKYPKMVMAAKNDNEAQARVRKIEETIQPAKGYKNKVAGGHQRNDEQSSAEEVPQKVS